MIQGARWHATEADEVIGMPGDGPEIAAEAGSAAAARTRYWPGIVTALLLGMLALGWIAGLVVVLAMTATAAALTPLRIAAWIGLGSAPLALIALVFLLLLRTGRGEAGAFARASARLRADVGLLAATLGDLNRQVATARADLAAQAGALATLGGEAATRIATAAADLGGQADAFTRTAATLDDATALARADLGVLLADLPRAEAAAQGLAERLRQGGTEADTATRALAELLARLDERARGAADSSGGAAARLAAQLDRVDEGARAAEQRLAASASLMANTVDGALDAAATGVEQARRAITDQSAALVAMVEQGRGTIDHAGEEAAARLGARLDALVARMASLDGGLAGQDAAARATLETLAHALDAAEARLAAIGDGADGPVAQLSGAMEAAASDAEALGRTLGQNARTADVLHDRMGQLRAQAEAGSTIIAETIPAALARMRLHTEQSLQTITAAGERGERLYDTAEAVRARLAEADALLGRQRGELEENGALATQHLVLLTDKAAALHTLLARAEAEVRALSEGASGGLVEALFRVREAANEAAAQAGDALTAAIPRAAQRLGESASRALVAAMSEVGQAEIDAVGEASTRAIEAARTASRQLAGQLESIAETATAIDARIAANRADTQAHDGTHFPRAMNQLIDALNTAAIDLARLFSTDVSDEAWRAYLRGDRGVFTRRAVRLLDKAEAGAVAERYGAEPDFRDLVGRYIADFEALLRRVLATADGMALATTMLSSDAGKLYVGLAQAIERLRR